MSRIDTAKTIDLSKIFQTTYYNGNKVWEENKSVAFYNYKGQSRYRHGTETGSNIDFLINYKSMKFNEAVNFLLIESGMKHLSETTNTYRKPLKSSVKEKMIVIDEPKKENDFDLIIKNNKLENNFGSYRYLCSVRGIDKDIFSFFYNNGYILRGQFIAETEKEKDRIYEEDWDKSVKKDKSLTYFVYRNPVTKEISGLTSRENNDLSKFVSNSRPYNKNWSNSEWGFGFLKGKPRTMTIFEAPIDLLSYLTIFKGDTKLNNNYLTATGGSNKIIIKNNIDKLIDEGLLEVVVATDNDDGGNKIYDWVYETFKGLVDVRRELSATKDWNEDLTTKLNNKK